MDYKYEENIIASGYENVCGIDEAGRGPLAGPLVTGAVILKKDNLKPFEFIQESKSLTKEKREEFFEIIINNAQAWSVGVINNNDIDKHGLGYANKLAMKKACYYLPIKPNYILTDYVAKIYFETPFESIKKGDRNVLSIACASIIAKVIHDRIMVAFAKKYPQYCFEEHQGYGTKKHLEKIFQYGACPIHRTSFGPLKAKLF